MNYNFLFNTKLLIDANKRYKGLSIKDKEIFDKHNKIFLANSNYINNHKYYRKDYVFKARYNGLVCKYILAKKKDLTPLERKKIYNATKKYVSKFKEYERKDD